MKKPEEFAEVLNALAAAFATEGEVQYDLLADAVLSEYHYLDSENPEKFSLLLHHSSDTLARALLKRALDGKTIDGSVLYKVGFVYKHYDFMDCHLKGLIHKYEGRGCSTDKTRFLIQGYLDYLLTGKFPAFQKNEKGHGYWLPKAGTPEEWVAFMDAMPDFYYAKISDYLTSMKTLMDCYASP